MSSSESDEFEVIDQLEASLSPEEVLKVQAWLQPTDYQAQSSEFHRHLSSQAPGTGLWICETLKYRQWQESSGHGSLWIKGVPGAGKSVTAASMIQHLQAIEGTPVLYFFFRYIISANRRPRSLVRDFLAQLLPYSARLQATLQPLINSPLDDFSDERLWEHLLTGLSSVEKAYCVVDALDEMELLPKDGFLDRLNNLATFRPSAVKLLMTSRPKQYLQSSLRDASIVHISLEDDLVGKDIALFLSYRLKKLLPSDDKDEFRKALVSAISERSDGLFLYARLLLDQIIPSLGATQLNVEGLVRTLPVGLEEMYNTMLSQQATFLGIDTQIQVFLLQLATHSSRALRLNEIASILALTFPASMIPDTPKALARSACAPLLEILEDETVSVIHHSFTEFLLNGDRANIDPHGNTPQFPVLNTDKVHKRLAVICINYLGAGGLKVHEDDIQSGPAATSAKAPNLFDDTPKETDGYNYQEAKLRYPFLEYAVGNWAFHASKYDFEDSDFFKSIAEFLDPDSVEYKKWLQLEWMKLLTSSEILAPTPLHVAAFAGLTAYAKRLLQDKVSVDTRDAEDRTPLHLACARGHTLMASLLLQNGATPDPEDTRGVKPIHEAARRNHATIVKMLLEAGVDPLSPKTKENIKRVLRCGDVSTIGETAVEYAWLQGHTDTILVMLPFLKPETLEELFCQCCRYGKFEAVRAILKATDVSPNSKYSGATALYLACRAQNVGIVELLLARGADVHQASKWKVTNRNACGGRVHEEPLRLPIHGVAMGWKSANNLACQQILRLLLNAGADIESKDADGNTTLLGLFRECPNNYDTDFVVVSGVLQAGANVLAVDKNGDSVLHRCLQRLQDIKILKILFEHGAQANVIGENGDTILHTAIAYSSSKRKGISMPDVINLLLERGARCDVKNNDGVTAAEYAACSHDCSLEIFTVLLHACEDVRTRKNCMWKLCARKDKKDTPKYIRLLQTLGVSLEERDSNGATVLLNSTKSKELFAAFLECGADLKAVDSRGRGVLHYYISDKPWGQPHENLQRLVQMVDMGLNPMQVDYEGNNLLHIRAKIYQGEEMDDLFIEKLLDYGISVDSKNKQGMTPLHVHLDNWNPCVWRNAVHQCLDERFYERNEIPLLNLFRRNNKIVDINAENSDGVTLFHLAALRSETRMFYLLEQGADPTLTTKGGRNALHLACRARQSNVVGYLSHTYPTMINHQDEYGRTPLHDACTSGQTESVRLLLQAGADITIVDKNKRTPLHACAEFGDEQKIWELLSRQDEKSGRLLQDRYRPTSETQYIYTPWYREGWRSPNSKVKVSSSIGLAVKILLSAGSDVLAVDCYQQTPLDLALRYDCQEMVEALEFSVPLLMKKWELTPEDRRLSTFLALKKLKSSRLSEMGLEDPARQQVFENLSMYLPFLTFNDVEWISQNGGSITGFDESKPIPSTGESLLHIAASKGLTQLMETFGPLARINDDPNIVLGRIHEQLAINPKYDPGVQKLAPTLHVACSRELPNMHMIEVLVEKCSVDVNTHVVTEPWRWARITEYVEGGTALHILANAQYWWQLEALKYLLQKGAKIDALNEKGETPLHISCTGTTYAAMNCENDVYGYWRIEAVKILLEAGADINVLDKNNLSCLNKASSSPQIMRILLEHGADITAGKLSPIFSAIQIQCLETLTVLLDAGVSPNIVDPNTGNSGFSMHYTVKDAVRSALMCASFANLHNQGEKHQVPMVKLLIERGADIYAALNEKETLIHYVFEHGEFEIVETFIECAKRMKIDFNTRDSLGRTVFIAACEWIQCLPGYQHRHWYPKATAPFLRTLELGANPMVLDNEGRNALHHLLDNTDMEEEAIVEFLAHDSAKPLLQQKDKDGFTPLNCALRLLRPAVVEVMTTMGQDLLTPDPTGATALHRIAEQCLRSSSNSRRSFGRDLKPEYYTGAFALWEKFLSLRGSINVRDNDGAPPLFYFLLAGERDIYDAPEDWCCHLEYFAIYFSEELALDLDFAAKNANSENALHIIARREKNNNIYKKKRDGHDHVLTHDKELYQFFVRKGLNPLEEDSKGRSSLDVAAACEQKGILELFQYGK